METTESDNFKMTGSINYGTKILTEYLEIVEKMTLEEYGMLYEQFKKDYPEEFVELSESAKSIIGVHGVERFELFCKIPETHNDYENQDKLVIGSVDTFNYFMDRLKKPEDTPVSIFLTQRGNLATLWRDKGLPTVVDIEYYPDRIEFFIEAQRMESSVLKSDIDKFLIDMNMYKES